MSKPTRTALSRRAFLRGAAAGVGVAIGLPALEIMLDGNATAYADGGALPSRFGVWFFGNGIRRTHWIPDGEGAGWSPRAELQPLVDAGLREWINVLTGFEIKTATHPHHSGMAGIMTGARYHQNDVTRDTIVSTFAHPSVDQVAAAAFEGSGTRLRSLEVGITRFRGTDEGTTFQHLSHNGPNNVNPSEYSPSNLFRRLFSSAPEPQIAAARRSVLDLVREQTRRLQGTLGSNDRRRLEQHLDSIRTLEAGLATGGGACMLPADPGDFPDVDGREQIEQQNRAMSDLLALALACDMTRAFSVLYSTAGSGVIVWPAGAGNGLHQMCHDEPGDQPTVHATVVFTMQQLAYFLARLRDTPEGDSNVLDRSSILITSELSEGNVHSNDDFPILTAGRACGRLRTGIHYRSHSRENTSKALLTTLRAAGVPLPGGFGHGAGHVTDGVSAIET